MEYGELLGLCFQIKDDIFDYFSDPEIGKPTGNDIREGKVTLPLLYAIRTADHDGKIRDLISSSSSLSTHQINLLIDFAKANGGIEYAYERMRIIQKEADKILLQYPDSEWKDALKEIFEFIISRNH